MDLCTDVTKCTECGSSLSEFSKSHDIVLFTNSGTQFRKQAVRRCKVHRCNQGNSTRFFPFFLGLWIIKSFCREVNSHISGNIRKHCHISGNSENFSTSFVSHAFVHSGIHFQMIVEGARMDVLEIRGRFWNPHTKIYNLLFLVHWLKDRYQG